MLPGFPKPEMEALGTTYELLQLQTKTQEWDPGKVSKHSLQLLLILNEGVLIGNIGYQGKQCDCIFQCNRQGKLFKNDRNFDVVNYVLASEWRRGLRRSF